LEFLQALREEVQNAGAANKRPKSEALVKSDGSANEAQSAQIHEKPLKSEGADEISPRRFQCAALFRFGAGVLEEFGIIDTCRAGGLTSEAAEAEIHFFAEGFCRLKLPVGDGAHEGDSSAGAIALDFRGVVSGAGGQTKAAVHALLHNRVV